VHPSAGHSLSRPGAKAAWAATAPRRQPMLALTDDQLEIVMIVAGSLPAEKR
jgi:hypothetical protein